MAKVYFQKGNISESGIVGMFLNEAQFTEIKSIEYLSHYEVKEFSDDDYNNFYTGKKRISVSDEGVISALDNAVDPENTIEEDFKKILNMYLGNLEDFVFQYPNHSKTPEIRNCIQFGKNIDYSSLTFPNKHPFVYLADNNAYIILSYI
tara:strand:- start:1006 stop:1452 length:447 start_codon:yes stop_codon:yes gene_type:complete